MRKGIMSLEELKTPTKKKLSMESILMNRLQLQRKMALEGVLDFFFGKKQVENKVETKKKLKVGEVITHLESFKDKEFTVKVYYDKIEDYLAFLDELIHVGLPFLEKDMERLLATFKYIESKGKAIVELDNIKELYKIAGINHPARRNSFISPKPEIDFKTFEITTNNYHDSKKTSNDPKFFVTYTDGDVTNIMEEYDIDKAEATLLAPLMTLDELIPSLDLVYPKNTTKLNKITLSPEDHNHSKVIDLAIKLIKECNKITLHGEAKKLKDLASALDANLTAGYAYYGDGDEYGLYRLFLHSNLYMYELKMGFEEDFIATFKEN